MHHAAQILLALLDSRDFGKDCFSIVRFSLHGLAVAFLFCCNIFGKTMEVSSYSSRISAGPSQACFTRPFGFGACGRLRCFRLFHRSCLTPAGILMQASVSLLCAPCIALQRLAPVQRDHLHISAEANLDPLPWLLVLQDGSLFVQPRCYSSFVL